MSRRRCGIEAAVALALFCGVRADAQAGVDEAQVRAAYVYNFLKFVEWPADSTRGPRQRVLVAIIGKGATADATAKFLVSKKLGDRPIEVFRVGWDQELAGASAVFMADRDAARQRHVLNAIASAPMLTIGDGEEFATRGGMIALVSVERRVRFDINVDAVRAARLGVSSKLLALSRRVHSTTKAQGQLP